MNKTKAQKNDYDTIILMKSYFLVPLIFLFSLGIFNITNAQSAGDLINIEMVPEIPKANEVVYVFLTRYATNRDAAQITYKVGGKTIKSGNKKKVFNFTMGGNGQRTTLVVSVKTADGGSFEKTYRLTPSSIDLLYQSSGFVPPFYKGKSLFSHQSKIEIVALPHIVGSNGAELNPKNLIYKWRKNGSVVETASGYGKNVYSLEGSIISRSIDIDVEATSATTGDLGYASIKITPIEPSITMYVKNPATGIEFQKGFSNNETLKSSGEITLVGMPFFFESTDYNDSLYYKWSINDSAISENAGKKTQTFRQKEGVSGVAKISLSIENTERILQYANSILNLSFESKSN